MEEAMVGSVIGSTIQVVIQNLLSVSVEEIYLFPDLKKDLQELKASFLMIGELLHDEEMQQVTKRSVNFWLEELESVAFEADNLFDELNHHVLRIRNQKDMMKKAQTFFTSSYPVAFRQKVARKIRDISKKLKLIKQEAGNFGLQIMKPVDAGFDAVAGLETDSFATDPIFCGREDDVSRITELLLFPKPTQEQFSILPIAGMGGLGKTSLARQVFHKVMSHFDNQIWIHVSQTFDPMTIFKKILESLTEKDNVEFGSREAVLRKLHFFLDRRRYLLVLDDVWNEGKEKWDDFLNSLSGISGFMGNVIIVTTRSKIVASTVNTLPIYELKSLPEDECWSIIKAIAFREGEVPSDYEIIGRNIVKRCHGLPLVAKVLGRLLFNKSKDKWLAVQKTWLSNFWECENTILKVLKLSFDHLSSPSQKKCFAYCSIFPKGFSIGRKQLIELWMAEGFLTADGSNDMETVGNNFFDLFVQNSLLQVGKSDHYGNVIDCNMHDLMHDLASVLLGSKTHQVGRYIGLESIRHDSLPIPKQQARCVRTLIFRVKAYEDIFLNFKSLHVLILTSKDVTELPSLIRKLVRLRLVDISHTGIKCLPNSIGKLYHLQTLRAKCCLRRLPNTLKYLTCLRHLHIPNIELPPKIGRLTSLQTLPYFQVRHEKGCRIGELGNLNNLKGELEIYNLERVDDKEEAKSACLFQKTNIFKLKFAWDKSRKGEIKDENVLDGLQPHPNLKSLEIYGFRGRCFPLWTLKMEVRDDLDDSLIGLKDLMEIRLINCEECEEIPILGHLPHLKSLYLGGLTNVRTIGSSFYGTDNCNTNNEVGKNTIILFPALERLQLIDMPNLREWVEVAFQSGAETQPREMVVFPRLKYLEIRRCCKLMSLPSHFPCLEELKIWEMDRASPLANICRSNSNSLTKQRLVADDTRNGSKKDSVPDPDSASTSELAGEHMPTSKRLWGDEISPKDSQPAYISDHQVERCKSEIREESTTLEDRIIKISNDLGGSRIVTISMMGGMSKFREIKLEILSTFSLQEILHLNNYFSLAPYKDDYLFSLMLKLKLNPKSTSENLVVIEIPTTDEWRRAFVLDLKEKAKLLLPQEPDCPNLVFLFLQRNNQLTSIPPSFFCQMPSLCFLDLSHTRIKFLPYSLFGLTKLQCLILKGCICLDSLPTNVKDLISMEVLDLWGTQLYNIPDEIGHLKRLQQLQLSFYGPDDESEYAHLPSDLVSPSIISQLQSLQALSIFVHPEDHRWTKVAGNIIEDVGKLKELTYLQIYFPTLQVLECFINESLSWKEQRLRKFKFVIGNDVKRIVSRVPDEVESKYDEHDRCFSFVNGDKISQVVKTVLMRTTAFYLYHHTEVQSLSEFEVSNFDKLKFCVLRECPKIQFMITGGEISESAAFFPNLEHLGFHYLWELKGICDYPLPSGSFEALKYLMVHTCPKLEYIGSQSMLGCLLNLEEFFIEDCESMKAIVRENEMVDNDAEEFFIEDCEMVDNDAILLPRLRELVLSYLPELATLGNGLSWLLSKTNKVTAQHCPKLFPETSS